MQVVTPDPFRQAAVAWHGNRVDRPPTLAERASRDLGARGGSWMGQLPEVIAAVLRRWSLTLHGVLPTGKELSIVSAVTTAAGILRCSRPASRT